MKQVCLHRRLQQTGETVHLYLDALKQIAASCCFAPAEYHSRLRDIFVAGLRNDEMLQKFYERDNLLTTPLEQVLAFARMLESAMDSVAATRDTSTSVNLETIQNIRKQGKQRKIEFMLEILMRMISNDVWVHATFVEIENITN